MCSNYRPDPRLVQWLYERLRQKVPDETWPTWRAPIVRRLDGLGYDRETVAAQFGLLPHWARDAGFGRRTYNARSETADQKPSFRDAWKRGRRCIVPAEVFFEPCYESGRAVRHGIRRRDGEVMGIAGLWDWSPLKSGDGTAGGSGNEAGERADERADHDADSPAGTLSFTMLTVNADSHPLMRRMHKPDDEKRMLVILPDERWDEWLEAPASRTRDFLGCLDADALEAWPEPLPPRSRSGK